MAAVIIRFAGLQDLEALCRLYFEFHEFHVRGVSDRLMSSVRPADTYEGSDLYLTLGKIIDDDVVALFVPTVDGQPVGFAEAYIRQDDPSPFKVAHRYSLLESDGA